MKCRGPLEFKAIRSIGLVKSAVRFTNDATPYFSRLIVVGFDGDFAQLEVELRQKIEFNKIELSQALGFSSVDVTRASGPLTTDPLVLFQWGLRTNGQTIFRDINDIQTEQINSNPTVKSDISLARAPKVNDSAMKRDVIVAVIDSGIDFDHEDLKANLLLNKKECDGETIPFKPETDKDGNGFKGDCAGWNFMENGDVGDNRPTDLVGHGTHVAGIIAAVSDNGIGTSGLSNRIKILPIKVNSDANKEPKKSRDAKPIPAIGHRVAQAILYAVKMKADFINFSLGWPVSADTQFMREAFTAAQKAGVIIVAASGNNTSSAPVFPCSYEGVVCVGATSIDGSVVNFSNFGGHVDLFAPGEDILSTFPNAIEPGRFSVKGYDMMSGTSQAAPFVTAQLAVLKGMNPQAPSDELVGRMLATSQIIKEKTKFALGGITNFESAKSVTAQPVVRPVFKSVSQVPFSMSALTFQIDLPIKNYWKASGAVRIRTSLSSPSVRLSKSEFAIANLGASEVQVLKLSGQIADVTGARDVMLQVEITVAGRAVETFQQRLIFTRRLAGDIQVQSLSVRSLQPLKDDELFTVVDMTGDQLNPEYYAQVADDAGVHVRLFRKEGNEYVEQRELLLPKAKKLMFLVRADLNYDGKSDYFASSSYTLDDVKTILYSYIDSNLNGLFGDASHLVLQTADKGTIDGGALDNDGFKTLGFVPNETKFGKMAMPVFFTQGGMPKSDRSSNPLDFETNTIRGRLYYFEPDFKVVPFKVVTRNFDNTVLENEFRSKLSLRVRSSVKILGAVPQTRQGKATGQVKLLAAVEDEAGLRQYEIETSASQLSKREFAIHALNLGNVRIEGGETSRIVGLNEDRGSEQSALVSFFSPIAGRLAVLDSSKITQTQMVQPERLTDSLLGFSGAYRSGGRLYGVFQTKSQLAIRIDENGKQKQYSAEIDRSSMIPGMVFNSVPFAIHMNIGGREVPAIYVDATQLTARRIHTWAVTDQGLIAPMHLNVEIPDNCRPQAPQKFSGTNEYSYVLLCKEASGLKLKTLLVR